MSSKIIPRNSNFAPHLVHLPEKCKQPKELMVVEWYLIALISAGWIALGIVYTYAFCVTADKHLAKLEAQDPAKYANEHFYANADTYAFIGLLTGLALIYLSWPIIIPVFGLINLAWGWWALVAAEVICFAIFMVRNGPNIIGRNEKRLEAIPKVLALIVSVIACGLMLVSSPVLLLLADME